MFKKFFKRLFCLHLNWHDGFLYSKCYPAWWEKEYECVKCGKRKNFHINNPPIQYIPNHNDFTRI